MAVHFGSVHSVLQLAESDNSESIRMKFPVVLISMVLCLSAVAVYGSFIGTRDDKEMVYGSNVDGSVACFSENIHTKGKGRIERRILITSAVIY